MAVPQSAPLSILKTSETKHSLRYDHATLSIKIQECEHDLKHHLSHTCVHVLTEVADVVHPSLDVSLTDLRVHHTAFFKVYFP